MQALGVHSEVGKLRTVMVCRPGLAHQRLTPGNAADLLFDDVIWVQEAQKDHYDFTLKMRERGTEVLDLHELLAQTLEDKAARDWVLERRITVNDVGLGVSHLRAWLDEMPAAYLAEHLIGGIAVSGHGSTRCRRPIWPSTSSAASPSSTCRRASGRRCSRRPTAAPIS
jgi:arginine deiminase